MHKVPVILDRDRCHRARLARDPRFDGQFFTAVTTTRIYCRPICPATAPHECNVDYYPTALAAARAGYRPCLRCRPDSAPDSPAWRGVDTTLQRALRLIADGALQDESLTRLSERLGISDRYLRQLFQRRFGISPKRYALYRQCQFATRLLHETALPVTDVAYASGFRSLRRFNDCFKAQSGFTPRDLRRTGAPRRDIVLQLHYRPPYAWEPLRDFLAARAIGGVEWIDDHSYGRTFDWHGSRGDFTATHEPAHHRFVVRLAISDLGRLQPVVANIRRLLDLDADTPAIEAQLTRAVPGLPLTAGLRLPGTWNMFEAGVRAILGQQVTVAAARRLVQSLCDQLGGSAGDATPARRCFPTATAVAASDLTFLRIPAARRATVSALATAFCDHGDDYVPARWGVVKGIGPWTINYARLRGASEPDIWLNGDAGIRRSLKALVSPAATVDIDAAAPWRSYLTLQLWRC